MGKRFSVFVNDACCDHGDSGQGPWDTEWTYCRKCGSKAKRDADGNIIDYTRGELDLNRPKTAE